MQKQQFINWVRTQITSIERFEESGKAEQTIVDVEKFDPKAAELYAANLLTLKNLKNHLKSRLG